MNFIFKYTLAVIPGTRSLPVSTSATFLSAQKQCNVIAMWFVESASKTECGRVFHLIETGDEVPDGLKYLGTVQDHDNQYVLHLFEEPGETKSAFKVAHSKEPA